MNLNFEFEFEFQSLVHKHPEGGSLLQSLIQLSTLPIAHPDSGSECTRVYVMLWLVFLSEGYNIIWLDMPLMRLSYLLASITLWQAADAAPRTSPRTPWKDDASSYSRRFWNSSYVCMWGWPVVVRRNYFIFWLWTALISRVSRWRTFSIYI